MQGGRGGRQACSIHFTCCFKGSENRVVGTLLSAQPLESGTGGSKVQCHPQLQSEFKASVGYGETLSQKKKKKLTKLEVHSKMGRVKI